jgi:hypothetical protein
MLASSSVHVGLKANGKNTRTTFFFPLKEASATSSPN